jgi:hypothetical protein
MNHLAKYILLFLLPLSVSAQLSEIGVFGGGANFVGDVGNGFNVSGFSTGLVYRFQFDEYYSIRFQGMYGTVKANDQQAFSDFKKNRNQEFQSNLIEASAIVEFNFFEFITGSKKQNHSPYIFAGLGVFTFNPIVELDGETIELQKLGTEGQGSSLSNSAKYGLSGLVIPFGLGYRYSPGKNISMSFEMGFRPTSSDYIDDVSDVYVDNDVLAEENGALAAYFGDRSLTDTDKTGTIRGDSQSNDWYVFSGITLVVALTPHKERCKRF